MIGKNAKKGQVAVEFLSYSSIFIIAATIIIAGILLFGSSEVAQQDAKISQEFISRVASSVSLANSIGPGFEYTIEKPKLIAGKEYNLLFRGMGSGKPSVVLILVDNSKPEEQWAAYSAAIPFNIKFAKDSASSNKITPETGTNGFVAQSKYGDIKLSFYESNGNNFILLYQGEN